MIEPKPLFVWDKEHAPTEAVLIAVENLYGPPNPNSAVVNLVRSYRALLAAEAFWRTLVQNLPETVDLGHFDWDSYCVVCGADVDRGEIVHLTECAWKLAQTQGEE